MTPELILWIDSIRHDHGWQSLDYYARESDKSLECETIPLTAIRERIILSKSRKQG